MENPTFHLENVVRNRDELDDFEGPLNLILMLLTKNKIEIRDIQISLILDQYLAYLEKMQEMDLEVASEFVQMASHLLYIKTRMLLSGDEEVSELEQLMQSLEQLKCKDTYLAVKTLVPELAKASEQGLMLFSTPGETMPQYGEYDLHHEPAELLGALARMLTRNVRGAIEEPAKPFMPERIVYGVREKSRELIALLRDRGESTMRELYAVCRSRSELVATFIAVLELCSTGSLTLTGDGDDYIVGFTGLESEEALENIAE
ncbi:MAG: segregation and condensation protein A [Candidatus Heteroscillospira sp.]|jgi:segregation and condensation protein A